jgi:hypothetical protein
LVLAEVVVTASVQSVLRSFDALSEADQHEVIVAVLHRTRRMPEPALPEETLLAAADARFCVLDQREMADVRAEPR